MRGNVMIVLNLISQLMYIYVTILSHVQKFECSLKKDMQQKYDILENCTSIITKNYDQYSMTTAQPLACGVCGSPG